MDAPATPAFDLEKIKSFLERLFALESDIKMLQSYRRQLLKDFKDQIDVKMVMQIVRLVKVKSQLECSEFVMKQLEGVVESKIDKLITP
jgi:uncharacterized protein (UPF0335 family)